MNNRPTFDSHRSEIEEHIIIETFNALISEANFKKSDNLLDDLRNIVSINSDSLDIAMELKYKGYSFDNSQAVEAIEYGEHSGRCKLKEIIKKWVKDNNIKPQLKYNDNISYKSGWNLQDTYNGIIVGVNKEEGYYIVHTGDKLDKKDECGLCINFERAIISNDQNTQENKLKIV